MRLQLHALAYNLGNFMRTLALPNAVKHWSLTSLREKLVKIGARIVGHGRGSVPGVLNLIDQLLFGVALCRNLLSLASPMAENTIFPSSKRAIGTIGDLPLKISSKTD